MGKLARAAELLRAADRIVILSHSSPDGDTLGSAAALCRALKKLGKAARCECADPVGPKYAYLFEGLHAEPFAPDFVVSVDVADLKLLGSLAERYRGRTDLAIDHHGSHAPFARETYVDAKAAATAEIIFELTGLLGLEVDPASASALYTGISTDTGCFRYSNVTPRTHRMAASLMERGARAEEIDRAMFETKSRARLEMERTVLEHLRFFCGGRCASIHISRADIARAGAQEDDLEGLASLPRQVEGVLAGITLREKEDGSWKASLRTTPPVDAARICRKFGGGGHACAAGCVLRAPLEEAERRLAAAVEEVLREA